MKIESRSRKNLAPRQRGKCTEPGCNIDTEWTSDRAALADEIALHEAWHAKREEARNAAISEVSGADGRSDVDQAL